jgi:hypothetical protein
MKMLKLDQNCMFDFALNIRKKVMKFKKICIRGVFLPNSGVFLLKWRTRLLRTWQHWWELCTVLVEFSLEPYICVRNRAFLQGARSLECLVIKNSAQIF